MTMFHVGQRVTPKNADKWNCIVGRQNGGPQFGKVYEIEGIRKAYGVICLEFEAWPNAGWDADDFRPVTDISALEALLSAQPSDLPGETPAEPAEQRVPVLHGGG